MVISERTRFIFLEPEILVIIRLKQFINSKSYKHNNNILNMLKEQDLHISSFMFQEQHKARNLKLMASWQPETTIVNSQNRLNAHHNSIKDHIGKQEIHVNIFVHKHAHFTQNNYILDIAQARMKLKTEQNFDKTETWTKLENTQLRHLIKYLMCSKNKH